MTNEQIAAAMASVESRCKSNTPRLDELERRQDGLDDLISSVKVLACRQETVERDVKEIKTDVKSLSLRPGKRWDMVTDKAICIVLTVILTYLLAMQGIR